MSRLVKLITSQVVAGLMVFFVLWFFSTNQPVEAHVLGSDLVMTNDGPVRGFQSGNTYAFLGIPFAAPPLDNQRWLPPADPEPWTMELDASAFSPICPQMDEAGVNVIGAEDCLTLNVWTPTTAGSGSDLPVMVYVHGGSNIKGGAPTELLGVQMFDGRYLAEQANVVVVTLQYRLGALGFLVHPGLDAESVHGGSGNYALLDQIKALQWVQDNIANFGGDPGQVLLFGESAGAINTCMLLTSPFTEGLFDRAIMQSGHCNTPPAAVRSAEGLAYAEAVGCDTAPDPVLCLRSQSTTTLVSAVQSDPFAVEGEAIAFGPNVDGYVLPNYPLDRLALGEHQQVPFLLGSNADELSVFIPEIPNFMYPLLVRGMLDPLRPGAGDQALLLYPVGTGPGEYPTAQEALAALYSDMVFTCPTRQIGRLTEPAQADPVWRYFFTQVLDSADLSHLGSFHALELFYLFQRVADIADYVASADDLALQEAMQSYWTRFAATGNPNGSGMVSWPEYKPDPDPYLDLGTPIAAGEGVRTEKCNFWDGLLPPSLALGGTTDPETTLPEAKLIYRFTLVNTGRDLDAVVLSSTLDADTAYVWASDGGVRSGNVVTWEVGTFTPTQRINRTLIVQVVKAPGDDLLANKIRVAAEGGISETALIETSILLQGWLNYLPLILR